MNILFFVLTLLGYSKNVLAESTDKSHFPTPYDMFTVPACNTSHRHLQHPSNTITFTLDKYGVFHRGRPPKTAEEGPVAYNVLKNGILVPSSEENVIRYDINSRGDLIPSEGNQCVYTSKKPAYYVQGWKKSLIPYHLTTRGKIDYVVHKKSKVKKHAIFPAFGKIVKDSETAVEPRNLDVHPDKTCNGHITLFLLQSNGMFVRKPADDYLPIGMKVTYELMENGCLVPKRTRSGVDFSYTLEKHGNLKPCSTNPHLLSTSGNTAKTFMLCEGGILAPVKENLKDDKTVKYYYMGHLIEANNQFKRTFSNTSTFIFGENMNSISSSLQSDGPELICNIGKKFKRSAHEINAIDSEAEKPGKSLIHCQYIFDERGKRIRIRPLIDDKGNVAICKLTCRGQIQRLIKHEEPDYNFEVCFECSDNLILTPVTTPKDTAFTLLYTLQRNGTLIPVKKQENSLKKAPSCFMYFIILDGGQLIPVQCHVLEENIDIYYQECLIYTITDSLARELKTILFTTIKEPLCAYVNSKLLCSYCETIKTPNGATWCNPNLDKSEAPSKNLYIVGPNQEKTKISAELNKHNVPTVFTLDCNGVFHKSPKDNNNKLGVVSYIVLPKHILKRTDQPGNYMFLVDKKGDMIPYSYPHSKLQSECGSKIKYIHCKGGLLVPIHCRVVGSYLECVFESVVIFKRRKYTLDEIRGLKVRASNPLKRNPFVIFKDDDGWPVYFILKGNHFRRNRVKKVEDYMVGSTGHFLVHPDGRLESVHHPRPNEHLPIIKVSLEKSGDMTADTIPKLDHTHFCLSRTGDLYPVSVSESIDKILIKNIDKSLLFDFDIPKGMAPPMGIDPLNLMSTPMPEVSKDTGPTKVSLPIAEKDKKKKDLLEMKKCSHIRDVIRDVFKGDPEIQNMEFDMAEALMQEFCKIANECSSGKKNGCA